MQNCHQSNKDLQAYGEELRNRYLYAMQEKKDVAKYLLLINKKNNIITNRILNLIRCH